jgi:hypothetical protein
MQTMTEGYRSLALILELHADKLVSIGTIAVALALGAAVGTLLAPTP